MKISIIQDGPVHLNLPATLEKATSYFEKAAQDGSDLIVFGECWFSGYPAWIDYCPEIALWDSPEVKQVWTQMYQNSLFLGSEELNTIQNLCKTHRLPALFGANEVVTTGKGNGSIYNALFIIDSNGTIQNHHRKVMPTFSEKLIHNQGDARGLKSVPIGDHRLGGLICWEHWMPLTRQAMHDSGETLHIGIWPTVKEMNRVASQHYAFEGRCYVLAVGQLMKAQETPDSLKLPDYLSENKDQYVMSGGTTAYGPDGSQILKPLGENVNYHVLEIGDVTNNIGEKMNLAVSGHYQRPDLFKFKVKRKRD